MNCPGSAPRSIVHAVAVARDVLDHHHGVGAVRQRSAGHDLDRLPGPTAPAKLLAGAHFADHAQLARQIGGAHRESVAHRARQRRIIAIGEDRLGQHASRGRFQFHLFDRWQVRSANRRSSTQARASEKVYVGTVLF